MSMAAFLGKGETDTPNLIRNGSFVGHIGGWYKGSVNITPTFADAVSRIGGSGCLSVMLSDANQGIISYREAGILTIDLDGATSVDIVTYGKSANASAEVTISLDFSAGNTFIDQASIFPTDVAGAGWTELALRDIDVPDGATHGTITVGVTVPVGSNPVYIDDFYVGPSGLDLAPYPAASKPPIPANRLAPFGDFEVDTSKWFESSGDEVILRDTVAPITGTGSLKCTTPGEDPFEGVGCEQDILITEGEPLRLSFSLKGEGDLECFVVTAAGFVGEIVWTGTATASPVVHTADFTVPPGRFLLREFYIVTVENAPAQEVTFWVDDISIGTPQS